MEANAIEGISLQLNSLFAWSNRRIPSSEVSNNARE